MQKEEKKVFIIMQENLGHPFKSIAMTYSKIQTMYKLKYGKTVKTCWIADIKREMKLTTRISFNRIDKEKVKYPCPEEIRENLSEIIKTCYNTV